MSSGARESSCLLLWGLYLIDLGLNDVTENGGVTMRGLIGAGLLLIANSVLAKSYVGVGVIDAKFHAIEFDRYYESDSNQLKQVKFGYSDKSKLEVFGDLGINTDNEIQDFALGLLLKNTLIQVENVRLSGKILQENTDVELGEYDNNYRRIDIINVPDSQGFAFGVAYQEYAVPKLFEYNKGGEIDYLNTIYLQDDAVEVKSLGLGIHYDPVRNFALRGYDFERGYLTFKNDWYLSSVTIFSIGKITTSDAPEMLAYEQDNKSKILPGFQGNYELGWMIGQFNDDFSYIVNIGYHLRSSMFLNDPEREASPGEISFEAPLTIIHGPTMGVSVSF